MATNKGTSSSQPGLIGDFLELIASSFEIPEATFDVQVVLEKDLFVELLLVLGANVVDDVLLGVLRFCELRSTSLGKGSLQVRDELVRYFGRC